MLEQVKFPTHWDAGEGEDRSTEEEVTLGDLCRDASLRKRALSHGKGPFCDTHRGGGQLSQQQMQILGQEGACCSWTRREIG